MAKRKPADVGREPFITSFPARVALSIGLIAALLAAGVWLGNLFQRNTFGTAEVRGDLSQRSVDARTMTYQDQLYVYNNAQTTILVMGVDKTDEQRASVTGYRNGGQADFLALLVLDPRLNTMRWLSIDRDTMTEITVLTVLGKPSGTRISQICLSHSFGDGGRQSDELTLQAVENLLLGTEIDFYVSLDMSAIEQINELVGGVTVTLEDDLSMLDPAMTKGATITLQGKQAEYYVRTRMQVGQGTNEERMRRQNDYMTKLLTRITTLMAEDRSTMEALYDGMEPYMETDMARGRMVNEAYKAQDYERKDPLVIEGEHIIGEDGFMQFHANMQQLEGLVIETFYVPEQ